MECGDVCLLTDEGHRAIEGSSRPLSVNLTVPGGGLRPRGPQLRCDDGTSHRSSGDVRHDTEHVVQPDPVAGLETAVHRLGAHARRRHLPLGIVRIGVVDVPRDLAVNADRLDLAEEPVS